jgi:ParB/RepB/Spo0J family partition protein
VQVPLQDIYIGKRFRTETIDIKQLEELVADFKNPEIGQLTPITIRPVNEDEQELGVKQPWALVAGGRRTAAGWMAGWTHIEAYAKDTMTELQHRIAELYENIHRVDLSWKEQSDLRAEILALRRIQNPGITQTEVAREIGESPATFSRNIEASEALKEHPELAQASSRKAAMRGHDMIQHTARTKARLALVTDPRYANTEFGLGRMRIDVTCQDARDYCLNLPAKSVDLLCTDPPYGIDYWKSGHKMRAGGANQNLGVSEFNDKPGPTMDMLADIVPLWVRALRETGWAVVFMNRDLYGYLEQLFKDCCYVHQDYRHEEFKGRCNMAIINHEKDPCRFLIPEPLPWIWYRKNSRNRPRYPEIHAQNQYESILVCNMGKGRLSSPCGNVLEYDAVYGDERVHAHQKPLPLIKDIVSRTTFVGDTVLDTFIGSGSHLAAASSLARRILGCDDNENMLDIAHGMISQHFQAAPVRTPTQTTQRYVINEKSLEGVYDFGEFEPEADES